MKYLKLFEAGREKEVIRLRKKLNAQKYFYLNNFKGENLILKFIDIHSSSAWFDSLNMKTKEIKIYYILYRDCKYFVDKAYMLKTNAVRNATKEEIEELEFYLNTNKYNL